MADDDRITARRTTSDDPHFRTLIGALDRELVERYGVAQDSYAPFNVFHTDTAIVLSHHATPLACGCFKPFAAAPATIELKRMFTMADARGRGLGRRLVDELLQWARELGYRRAVLETGIQQPEAIGLYRKCGFVETAKFGPYVDLPLSVCFAKAL